MSDYVLTAVSERSSSKFRRRETGFTLVELLTVLSVIGLLVAILIPSTESARIQAKRARTKVQFAQWALALGQFRQEYGYYPAIDGGSGGKIIPELFAGALTGRKLDGLSEATGAQLGGNSRALRFYTISEGDLNPSHTALTDAFGNTDIAVLWDKNGDEMITRADGEAVAVTAANGDAALQPESGDLNLETGIRAELIFYSAGRGTKSSDLIFSWK